MTRRGTHTAAGIAIVGALLALGLASCGTEQPPAAPSPGAGQIQRFLEEQITTATDALGTRRIERVAEIGCTSTANPEVQAKVTQWEASTSLDVPSEAEANQMGRDLSDALIGENWKAELDGPTVTNGPHRTLLQATSPEDGYRLNVVHINRYGENYVSVVMTSPCQRNPEGHQMVRSPLDPGHGKYGDGRYDYDAETKALAEGSATPAATPQPSRPPDSAR